MANDTRDRNFYFNKSSISRYAEEYASSIFNCLRGLQSSRLDEALQTLRHAKRIYVAGNGGSATIADHLCCDWQKGTDTPNHRPIQATPLTGSISMFTAIANDIGYERTFSYQLERLALTVDDAVILISSSGNSPNIIQAAKMAKYYGSKVLGLTGFDGGELKKISDVSIHVDVFNYGVIEDCHQAIMHILAQFYYLENK